MPYVFINLNAYGVSVNRLFCIENICSLKIYDRDGLIMTKRKLFVSEYSLVRNLT